MRNDFERARKAAIKAKAEFDRVRRRWPWMTFDDLDKLAAAQEALRPIAELRSPNLPRGRNRARFNRHSAREVCAFVMIEAWASVRGKPPGATNLAAQKLCAAYWCASGGKSIGDPENWRRALTTALNDDSALRRWIRYCVQNTH